MFSFDLIHISHFFFYIPQHTFYTSFVKHIDYFVVCDVIGHDFPLIFRCREQGCGSIVNFYTPRLW